MPSSSNQVTNPENYKPPQKKAKSVNDGNVSDGSDDDIVSDFHDSDPKSNSRVTLPIQPSVLQKSSITIAAKLTETKSHSDAYEDAMKVRNQNKILIILSNYLYVL